MSNPLNNDWRLMEDVRPQESDEWVSELLREGGGLPLSEIAREVTAIGQEAASGRGWQHDRLHCLVSPGAELPRGEWQLVWMDRSGVGGHHTAPVGIRNSVLQHPEFVSHPIRFYPGRPTMSSVIQLQSVVASPVANSLTLPRRLLQTLPALWGKMMVKVNLARNHIGHRDLDTMSLSELHSIQSWYWGAEDTPWPSPEEVEDGVGASLYREAALDVLTFYNRLNQFVREAEASGEVTVQQLMSPSPGDGACHYEEEDGGREIHVFMFYDSWCALLSTYLANRILRRIGVEPREHHAFSMWAASIVDVITRKGNSWERRVFHDSSLLDEDMVPPHMYGPIIDYVVDPTTAVREAMVEEWGPEWEAIWAEYTYNTGGWVFRDPRFSVLTACSSSAAHNYDSLERAVNTREVIEYRVKLCTRVLATAFATARALHDIEPGLATGSMPSGMKTTRAFVRRLTAKAPSTSADIASGLASLLPDHRTLVDSSDAKKLYVRVSTDKDAFRSLAANATDRDSCWGVAGERSVDVELLYYQHVSFTIWVSPDERITTCPVREIRQYATMRAWGIVLDLSGLAKYEDYVPLILVSNTYLARDSYWGKGYAAISKTSSNSVKAGVVTALLRSCMKEEATYVSPTNGIVYHTPTLGSVKDAHTITAGEVVGYVNGGQQMAIVQEKHTKYFTDTGTAFQYLDRLRDAVRFVIRKCYEHTNPEASKEHTAQAVAGGWRMGLRFDHALFPTRNALTSTGRTLPDWDAHAPDATAFAQVVIFHLLGIVPGSAHRLYYRSGVRLPPPPRGSTVDLSYLDYFTNRVGILEVVDNIKDAEYTHHLAADVRHAIRWLVSPRSDWWMVHPNRDSSAFAPIYDRWYQCPGCGGVFPAPNSRHTRGVMMTPESRHKVDGVYFEVRVLLCMECHHLFRAGYSVYPTGLVVSGERLLDKEIKDSLESSLLGPEYTFRRSADDDTQRTFYQTFRFNNGWAPLSGSSDFFTFLRQLLDAQYYTDTGWTGKSNVTALVDEWVLTKCAPSLRPRWEKLTSEYAALPRSNAALFLYKALKSPEYTTKKGRFKRSVREALEHKFPGITEWNTLLEEGNDGFQVPEEEEEDDTGIASGA